MTVPRHLNYPSVSHKLDISPVRGDSTKASPNRGGGFALSEDGGVE